MTGRKDLAVKLAASGLGLGSLPLAPGTWASAAAAAAAWGLRVTLPPGVAAAALGGLSLTAAVLGLAVCRRAERAYGRKDPRQFVLDELAGQWLTCLLFWRGGPLVHAASAFVAFRVFDIVKPFPIRRIEKLPAGWGVVTDDLVAGVYAAAALWVVFYAGAGGLYA